MICVGDHQKVTSQYGPHSTIDCFSKNNAFNNCRGAYIKKIVCCLILSIQENNDPSLIVSSKTEKESADYTIMSAKVSSRVKKTIIFLKLQFSLDD